MKKYTISEIEQNKDLVIFLDNKEEHTKIIESKLTEKLVPYYGKYCYSLYDNTYSSNSNENYPGAYKEATIVKFNQIDFQDTPVSVLDTLELW
jgi:hypothetical protein